jgi:hypothetical protein
MGTLWSAAACSRLELHGALMLQQKAATLVRTFSISFALIIGVGFCAKISVFWQTA